MGLKVNGINRKTSNFTEKDTKKIIHYTCYHVSAEPCLGLLLHRLGGTTGRKTCQNKELHEWLKKAPSSVKRAFLSGYQGGDGSKINVNYKLPQQQVRIKETKMSTSHECVGSNTKYMEDIAQLFKDLGIKATVRNYKAKDPRRRLILLLSLIHI